jgi:hypothetical protein
MRKKLSEYWGERVSATTLVYDGLELVHEDGSILDESCVIVLIDGEWVSGTDFEERWFELEAAFEGEGDEDLVVSLRS